MNQFKATLHQFLSNESHTPIQPIMLDEHEEIVALRDECQEIACDKTPIGITVDVKEANCIRSSLIGAVDQIKAVSQTPPALLEASVLTANDAIVDAANVMGVDAPAPLVIDSDTLELSEPSMEGVLSWLSNAIAAFGKAMVKLKDRIVLGFHRFGTLSIALKRRVSKSYSLLPRRHNPDGGKVIKLKLKDSALLVLNEQLVIDPIKELTTLGTFTSDVIHAYIPVIDAIHQDLAKTFTELVAFSGHWSGAPLNVDIASTVAKISAFEKQAPLFLGNVSPKLIPSKAIVPALKLVPIKPSAEFIASNAEVISLSSERIRSILLGVQKEIDMRMSGIEDIISDLDTKITALIDGIGRVNSTANSDLKVGGVNAVHGIANQLDNLSKLANMSDLNRLEGRVYQELIEIYNILDELHHQYFERVGAVCTLVEESLLQD